MGRGNLNRYILHCFVVRLLAITPRRQLIRREPLQKVLTRGYGQFSGEFVPTGLWRRGGYRTQATRVYRMTQRLPL